MTFIIYIYFTLSFAANKAFECTVCGKGRFCTKHEITDIMRRSNYYFFNKGLARRDKLKVSTCIDLETHSLIPAIFQTKYVFRHQFNTLQGTKIYFLTSIPFFFSNSRFTSGYIQARSHIFARCVYEISPPLQNTIILIPFTGL